MSMEVTAMHGRRLIATGLLAALSVSAFSQGDPKTIEKIVDEGKNRNQVTKHLWHLTKNIGPRLTGSQSLERAQQWAMKRFTDFGLKNVHLEEWGEVQVGFQRGLKQSARMVSPTQRDFEFTSPAWSPGTDGPLRGRAVMEPENEEAFEKVKGDLKGAWVIMRSQAGMRTRNAGATDSGVAKLLDEAGIAGRVFGTQNERVHTSGNMNITWDNLPTRRVVMIRKSDRDAVVAELEAGKKVELEIEMEQRFLKGPIKQYNVIADIPGTEFPDEYVIVCGHLDSWDGPGSEGACDNGTGSVVAIEAARILMAAGVKPKRTIRFILWSGEEQGLHGSRRYVEMHRDKMDKISMVWNDDGGTNYQGGAQALAEAAEMLREAIKPTQEAFPNLPMRIDVVERIPRGGSSDHAPFNVVGTPGFFTIESGRADYGHVWHTQNDKYEYAIPEYLVQSSTNAAIVAFNIAQADKLLPRVTVEGTPGLPVGMSHNWLARDGDVFSCGHMHEDEVIEIVMRLLASMRK